MSISSPIGAVDHLLHVRVVAEHERQVEHVELGHQRSHGTDADARDLQRADLRLLDHFLLAAELHRRIHLDAEPAVAGGLEPLAHAHDGFHRRIAQGMHVGRLQHHLLLGDGRMLEAAERGRRRQTTKLEQIAPIHDILPKRTFLLTVGSSCAAVCACYSL